VHIILKIDSLIEGLHAIDDSGGGLSTF